MIHDLNNAKFPYRLKLKILLNMKSELERAVVHTIDEEKLLKTETYASYVGLAATLNRDRPVAFWSITLDSFFIVYSHELYSS